MPLVRLNDVFVKKFANILSRRRDETRGGKDFTFPQCSEIWSSLFIRSWWITVFEKVRIGRRQRIEVLRGAGYVAAFFAWIAWISGAFSSSKI